MANPNLDIAPQQSEGGGAPGANMSALNRINAEPTPRGAGFKRLAAAVSKLPYPTSRGNARDLFLP